VGEEEYVRRIRAMRRPALLKLWERLWSGRTLRGWPPGKAFELLVLRAFELEGAHIVWPYLSSRIAPLDSIGLVEQIDGAIYVDGMSCLVESKHQRMPIDFKPIARFKARLDRRPPGVTGLMFSVSGFTKPALLETCFHPIRNVLLWTGLDFDFALERGLRTGLRAKWRHAVERAVPDLALVDRETGR
jgi:hypothetical protein